MYVGREVHEQVTHIQTYIKNDKQKKIPKQKKNKENCTTTTNNMDNHEQKDINSDNNLSLTIWAHVYVVSEKYTIKWVWNRGQKIQTLMVVVVLTAYFPPLWWIFPFIMIDGIGKYVSLKTRGILWSNSFKTKKNIITKFREMMETPTMNYVVYDDDNDVYYVFDVVDIDR